MFWVIGLLVATTVVTLLQFVRSRDRRMLPLAALFALLAAAHSQDDWYVARGLHLGAALAGIVLLVMLSPRQPPVR